MNTQMSVPNVTIFGLPVSKLGMDETVEYITNMIEYKQKPHQIITANPIMIMSALEAPSYMAMMKRAELIVPDGIGVVWASGYAGNPVKERVPGFELMHRLMALGNDRKWKVFLLGTSPEVISLAADKLRKQYPNIIFVGIRDGYFKVEQDQEVIAQIRSAEPDLLFVGRAADTQEPWIDRYKEQLEVPVMMGVGGSFDVIAGKLKRAPVIFQKLRLEWFFRLLQQPTRYKRMLALPKFVIKVICHKENIR